MPDAELMDQPEFREAYRLREQQDRLHSGKVAAALVIVLMPVGVSLDLVVYPGQAILFLVLRLVCALFGAGLFWLHTTPFGKQHYRWLGLPIAFLPAATMSAMVACTQGATSPYYAGLNLVLLAVSMVVRWTVRESLLAVVGVLAMYFLACILYSLHFNVHFKTGEVFGNSYFIVLTGVIVVVGNYFYNRLQFREFALRFELDRNQKALAESNQKLKEMDEIKSRFFANISHELRTPLTLLIAPLETLLQRFGRSADEQTHSMLLTMQSNGMRLLKLINDLLDLVRLESGRMEVKSDALDVAAFVKGIASAARQVAEDKRLRLETVVDPALGTLLIDRDKLDKIVLNLVFNAMKFTPSGGRVELRAEKQGEEFVLAVADTGMGISEKNLAHVFDRFWQADGSSKRKFQGMGIGLALVKELVEIQGGQVIVTSQEGKGTTFTVRLPFRPAATQPAPQTEGQAEAGTGTESAAPAANHGGTVTSEEWLVNLYRRAELFPALTPVQASMRPVEGARLGNRPTILIADDEPDMLRFLKSQLSAPFQVLEAVDGQQAVEKAKQFLPDIILLDMMMPEKDGLQACREIRAHTPTQSIPVVLLTARADEDTKLSALSAGASDFLTKPFSSTELHVRLKNLVESHQYQRKVSKQNQVLESTIEQLKETETQLVQSEKLASLGRMSAGIIHEINNPLNFATTGLFTLRNKGKYLAPEQQEEYKEVLKDVEEGIQRVKTIVSDLRTFTHPETESRDQVAVTEIVTPALRFLSNEFKDRVRIEQNLTPGQTVYVNKNKLIQVLVNLVQNALDAMKHKTFVEEQPTIWIQSRVEAGKSLLILRDNGTGIERKHLDKIFDPFFTTKDVGEGMGLGLAICHRIIQDCDGKISVRTELGKFTEFTLEFPAQIR